MRRSLSYSGQIGENVNAVNSHELFRLDRILAISTLSANETSRQKDHDSIGFSSAFKSILPASARELMDGSFGSASGGSQSNAEHAPVSIISVTHGGTKGNEFLAAYLSNNYLIFRYSGENGVPVVRQLPWFKDPSMRIMGMAFNHTAQWCMCVTTDVTVILIPIYFLMLRRGQAAQSTENMIKIIKTASINAPQKKRKVTSCLWWRSHAGQEYGIVASESGSLRFINLISQECLRLKLKDPAIKMQVVSNSSKTVSHLLLHGPQSSFHSKLLLESRSPSGNWKTIITAHQNPEFQPLPLSKFPRTQFKLRSQTSDKGAIVSVFNRQTSELQLFDASQDFFPSNSSIFPMFRYLLAFEPTVQTQLVHVGEHILFVFGVDESKNMCKLQIVSRRLSEAKTAPGNAATSPMSSPPVPTTSSSSAIADGFALLDQTANNESILQEFYLRGTDIILGYLSPLPKSNSGFADPASRFQDAEDAHSDNHDATVSVGDGGYFYTKDAIFQIKPFKQPEEIFYSLVAAGLEKTKAEPLGLSFGLDLLHLYELAADAYFEEGQDARALELYYLSEVSNTKLVSKFLEVGRINVIITRLRAALQRPRSLSINEKKKLSNLLLHCFLHNFLNEREVTNGDSNSPELTDEEFEKFLRYNEDYDAHQALLLFQQHGLMRFFTVVAHARGLMPRALNLMMSERGHSILTPSQLDYLRLNGFSEDVKNVAGGRLMSSFGDANRQLELYLSDLGTVYRYLHDIFILIPELDAPHLELVARFFDPLDCGSNLPHDDRLEAGKPMPRPPTPFDCCEVAEWIDDSMRLKIFMTACLHLQKFGAKHRSPWPTARGLQPSKVAQVACGYNHSCARTETGQVFSWGSNSKGQLGQNNPDLDYCATPRRIEAFRNSPVDVIACGGNHCIAANTSSEFNIVYVWGDNSFGQLATNDREDRWSPVALGEALFPPSRLGLKVKSIDCGFYHTAVLTDSGLFTAGQGICGQLGHSDTNDSLVFRFVNGLPKASMLAQVCCGYSHTIVRTEQGDLWSFGTNLYGQLGLGHKIDPVPEPQAVAELGETKRILEVSCGSFTTSALTSLGNILMWGRAGSSKSSIASDDPAFDVAVPKLVDTLHGASCSKLASGPNHSIAITEKGTIYVWGPAGRSMASSRLVSSEPLSPGILAEFVPGSAKQLACGDECNMILTTSGTLFACGSGGFGKLGTGSTVDRKQPLMVFLDAVENVLLHCVSMKDAAPLSEPFQPCVYATDDLLLTVLRTHVPQDIGRSRMLIPITMGMNHLSATATIFDSLGQHAAGLEARIKRVEQLAAAGDAPNAQKQTEALIQGVPFLPVEDNLEKAFLLERLLETWTALKFPVERLETVLLAKTTLLALVGELMNRAAISEDNETPIAGLKFSSEFYLQVVHATIRAEEERSTLMSPDGTQTSIERLWTQIKANLEKDYEKRFRLLIPQVELRDHSKQRGSAAITPGDVVFTCGHLFTEKAFNDEILPQFREKVSALPVPLPLTLKMLMSDYQLSMINLACPVCVYNYLRERHNQPGKPAIEKWLI